MKTTPPVLPYVGAVIRYGYLWRNQRRRVLDGGGRKDRPCLILALQPVKDGGFRVYVAPLTSAEQEGEDQEPETGSINLTAKTARKLGRDSRLVCTEVNDFLWRGLDVVPLESGADHYGKMPAVLVEEAKRLFRERYSLGGHVPSVNRDPRTS